MKKKTISKRKHVNNISNEENPSRKKNKKLKKIEREQQLCTCASCVTVIPYYKKGLKITKTNKKTLELILS